MYIQKHACISKYLISFNCAIIASIMPLEGASMVGMTLGPSIRETDKLQTNMDAACSEATRLACVTLTLLRQL
jgi:hypothetical protein